MLMTRWFRRFPYYYTFKTLFIIFLILPFVPPSHLSPAFPLPPLHSPLHPSYPPELRANLMLSSQLHPRRHGRLQQDLQAPDRLPRQDDLGTRQLDSQRCPVNRFPRIGPYPLAPFPASLRPPIASNDRLHKVVVRCPPLFPF